MGDTGESPGQPERLLQFSGKHLGKVKRHWKLSEDVREICQDQEKAVSVEKE
ncbi:hypothetical protein KI387_030465, partial [Taxus chinensis]